MSRLGATALLRHGLFGLPLAMAALPIYMYVPQFYAAQGVLSLAQVGLVLLVARVAAAFLDPLLGYWIERGRRPYASYIVMALPLLLLGFGMLFHPPRGAQLGWVLAALLLVYAGFGLASIAYQSWGAALAYLPGERARLTGVREGCALAGVMLAAGLASAVGLDGLVAVFAITLLAAAAALLGSAHAAPAKRPVNPGALLASAPGAASLRHKGPDFMLALAAPFTEPRFRTLFKVMLASGLANAIPATLFLFFVADCLALPALSGLFLMAYFGAAVVSIPCWVWLADRLGEARAWCTSMLLAALVLGCAYAVAPGAVAPFAAICVLSGLALGADLALPPALLAGVIARAGHGGRQRAAYFGLWNWGLQMTLALAAGIALPLLQWTGYVPGAAGGGATLAMAYALLPCALKIVACAMLWRAPLHDC